MKTAVIADIHGNYPAFQAVLADARKQGAERYVFLGDYIFDMPWSNQVCREIMDMPGAILITGNKEARLHKLSLSDPEAENSDQVASVYQHLRELDPQVKAFLMALPERASIPLEGGGELLAIHHPEGLPPLWRKDYSTSNFFWRYRNGAPTHAALLEEFSGKLKGPEYVSFLEGLPGRGVLFGHNHLQYWTEVRGKLVLNPGSAGLPADMDPRPAYTLLEERDGEFRVWERRVEYDLEAAIRAARESEVYARSPIWMELLFRTLRTARDHHGAFLRYVGGLAEQRGIETRPFPNDLWREAYQMFTERLNAGEVFPRVPEKQ